MTVNKCHCYNTNSLYCSSTITGKRKEYTDGQAITEFWAGRLVHKAVAELAEHWRTTPHGRDAIISETSKQ